MIDNRWFHRTTLARKRISKEFLPFKSVMHSQEALDAYTSNMSINLIKLICGRYNLDLKEGMELFVYLNGIFDNSSLFTEPGRYERGRAIAARISVDSQPES